MAATKALLLMFMLMVSVALIPTQTAAARALLAGEKGEEHEAVVKDKAPTYRALIPDKPFRDPVRARAYKSYCALNPNKPCLSPGPGKPYTPGCTGPYCKKRPPQSP